MSSKWCVAAVKGDLDDLLALMHKIGSGGILSAEDYRAWPVFRGFRTNDRFISAFEGIFGQPLITSKATGIGPQQPDETAPPAEGSETMH
jgi:hypothetical protein